MTTLEIRPFAGVGPVDFGQSIAQVGDLLGAPERIDSLYGSSGLQAIYPDQGVSVQFDAEGRCCLIAAGGLNPVVVPTFEDITLDGPLSRAIESLSRRGHLVQRGAYSDFLICSSLGFYLLARDEDEGVEPWIEAAVAVWQREMLEELRS